MSETNINDMNLRAPDPIAFEMYEDASGGGQKVVLPPRNSYTLLPTEAPVFGATKDGYLQAELTPLVVLDPGQPWDGYKVNFTRVSTKKWPKRNGSGFADYLRSHGAAYQGAPTSNEEYMQAAQALVNHPAHAVLDWECYCKQCGKTILKGMANFPKNEDGSYEQRVKCPNCSTAEDPKWLFANVRVVAFTPPTA